MQLFLDEKIEHYKNQMISALDRNDSTEAIKSRAILKELECIRDFFLTNVDVNNASKTIADSTDLSSKEVAEILGVHISTVTRNADSLGGHKYKGSLWFPKNRVYEVLKKTSGITKRGRKPTLKKGRDNT